METPFLDSHLDMYERLQKVNPDSVLYSQVIEEIKYLKALNENNCDKLPVSNSAVLNELLSHQIEVLCSPVRFNGVHVEDIKSVFKKHGVKYESPF